MCEVHFFFASVPFILFYFYHIVTCMSDMSDIRHLHNILRDPRVQGSPCQLVAFPLTLTYLSDMSVLHDILIFFLDVPFLYARSFWHWKSVLRLQNAVGMVQSSSMVWLVSITSAYVVLTFCPISAIAKVWY